MDEEVGFFGSAMAAVVAGCVVGGLAVGIEASTGLVGLRLAAVTGFALFALLKVMGEVFPAIPTRFIGLMGSAKGLSEVPFVLREWSESEKSFLETLWLIMVLPLFIVGTAIAVLVVVLAWAVMLPFSWASRRLSAR
jgi:hypothetical protein